ncbi:MAG: hypothetical protein QOE14_1026, partial [Humisphaera sp.]|nr:hypothetical protein [Humisphaera sp.]
AALVAPGGTIITDGSDVIAPAGTMLLEAQRVLDMVFPLDPGTSPPTIVTIGFRSQVWRDTNNQHLTIVYLLEERVDPLPDLFNEVFAISIKSFAGFKTDITSSAALKFERSADGSTINGTTPAPADDIELPVIAIATNATEFDGLGNIEGTISGGIPVLPPSGAALSTPFSLPLTYQPIGAADGGGGNAIPLPAGVWSGLIALVAGGALTSFRRKFRTLG